MTIFHDFSYWDQTLYNYAKTLISNKEILVFDSTNVVGYGAEYDSKQAALFNPVLEAHLYWMGFGVGIECLAKAVLIKHKVMEIKKIDFTSKLPRPIPSSFASYEEAKEFRKNFVLNDYQKVYMHAQGTKIKIDNNPWLKQIFSDLGIDHPREILTPTLGKIYNREIPKLQIAGIISSMESEKLCKSLELFTIMRRNVDVHIFLQSRIIGSIDNDIKNVYIPMINLLSNVYLR